MDLLLVMLMVIGGLVASGGGSGRDYVPPEIAMEEPDPGPAYEAEDQTPSGKFTTATEVRPILSATRRSWIAVREWNGEDLVYFTNVLAWRCGLLEISYAINDGPFEVFPAEPCHSDQATPNALMATDYLPYVTLPLGSVQTVSVRLLLDDLSEEAQDYDRASVQIN